MDASPSETCHKTQPPHGICKKLSTKRVWRLLSLGRSTDTPFPNLRPHFLIFDVMSKYITSFSVIELDFLIDDLVS